MKPGRRPFHVRLGRAFSLGWRELRGQPQTRNAFAGAEMNRYFLDWIAAARPADDDIRADARILRARAREQGRNNPYISRYYQLLTTNVIGPTGMKMQVRGVLQDWETPDPATSNRTEKAWRQWARGRVTVDGRHTLVQFEHIVLRNVAQDGEVLVRKYAGFPGNRYGFALQAIDADLLDEALNRQRGAEGNEIRMGVEVDELARPVAYWLWDQPLSAFGISTTRKRYRVPANEIIHLYRSDRVNQTRGVTWIKSVMVPARLLDTYEESEAVAARTEAGKMGFFLPNEHYDDPNPEKPKEPIPLEAAPGTLSLLPKNIDFKAWDPQHPASSFAAFIKQMLRKIATGLSMFYNALANDAEGVTYSSMRSFLMIEHDDWRTLQGWWIEDFRQPVYEAWLSVASLVPGALGFGILDPARYFDVKWMPRGWDWIDPVKEVTAAILAIGKGLGTRTRFLAEKGEDIEEVFEELKREQEMARDKGISIDGENAALTFVDGEDGDGAEGNGNGNAGGKKNRLAVLLSRR